jgi:hypothetical protein
MTGRDKLNERQQRNRQTEVQSHLARLRRILEPGRPAHPRKGILSVSMLGNNPLDCPKAEQDLIYGPNSQ